MTKPIPTRLGDVVNFKRGYVLPESARLPGPYPVISSAGISGYHNEFKVRGEGIVTGRYGTLGEMHYYNGDYWPHNTALYVTDFKGNVPKYVYYLLTCLGHPNTGDKSAVPGVNRNDLHELVIPLIAGQETQQKIAAVLSALDAKIDLNHRINTELEALAKTIYDYWFMQFDFPFDFARGRPDARGRPYKSSGGAMVWNDTLKREIPAGWRVGSIRAVAELAGGGTPSKSKPDYWDGDIAFFTPADAVSAVFQLDTTDHITETGLAACSSAKFEKGTVFITARGSVGKVVIAGRSMAMNQSCYALIPKTPALTPFLYFHTQSLVCHLQVKATGSTFGSIVTNDIDWTNLVIPRAGVMDSFSEIACPIFDRIAAELEENEQLVRLRDWLLPLLMNGQVRVA